MPKKRLVAGLAIVFASVAGYYSLKDVKEKHDIKQATEQRATAEQVAASQGFRILEPVDIDHPYSQQLGLKEGDDAKLYFAADAHDTTSNPVVRTFLYDGKGSGTQIVFDLPHLKERAERRENTFDFGADARIIRDPSDTTAQKKAVEEKPKTRAEKRKERQAEIEKRKQEKAERRKLQQRYP